LQVRLDAAVLLVEEGEIGNQVLDDIGVWQRVDSTFGFSLGWDPAKTREGVDTVDVHGAGTTDAFSAGSSEGQGWVQLVFDADECVQHHWAGFVEIQRVFLHPGFLAGGVWIPTVDFEGLHVGSFLGRGV